MPANNPRRAAGVVLVATLLGALLVAGATAGLAQDGDETPDNETEDGTAQVRIAHAVPNAPAVDVAVDGETVLENVTFGTVSDYLSVDAGARQVTVTAANDSEAVYYDETLPIRTGTYTVAAAGEVGDDAAEPFTPVILLDEGTEPDEDEALVRLAHLAPDAPAVDVTVVETDEALFENVSFANSSEYQTVPAGNYTLDVRPADDADADPVATVNVTLDNGTAYTGFAVGYLDPEAAAGDEPFDVVLEADQLTAPTVENETGETPDIQVETAAETPTDDGDDAAE
ncbi:protein of unknown function [Halorientalis persicus]|uniref:DUF4397 domain-containing protein n=1 Tax=Halorientalis persicus TaxID=1367881 RepID=A0A1H8H1Q1_9EURY|nr:DUF4397 domain-containing protein [Halorientalis persicus]SEN50163.1 protein of unknown function [Halorientalis persicus]